MKKSKLLVAALIAAGAMQAHAVPTNWGPHDTIEFGDDKLLSTGTFEDAYAFSLADTTTLSASAVSNNLGQAFNIDDGTVRLFEVAPGPDVQVGSFTFDGTTGSTPHTFDSLSAGEYYYLVSGVASGVVGGWYSLASAIAAPVPEPHVASLMLAGLGALGMLVRRRSRKET
jgi:hypothetical protein